MLRQEEPAILCPKYEQTFHVLGKKWNALIIDVLSQDVHRFSDIARSIQDISDRVLTERLHELECENIVERYIDTDICLKKQYRLTKKGQALAEATILLKSWAKQWV